MTSECFLLQGENMKRDYIRFNAHKGHVNNICITDAGKKHYLLVQMQW